VVDGVQAVFFSVEHDGMGKIMNGSFQRIAVQGNAMRTPFRLL
jgi:hypothetical protein